MEPAEALQGEAKKVKSPNIKDGSGLSYNEGKPKIDLMPTLPYEGAAKAAAYFARQREWINRADPKTLYSMLSYHINKFWAGHDYDKYSKIHNLDMASAVALLLLENFPSPCFFDGDINRLRNFNYDNKQRFTGDTDHVYEGAWFDCIPPNAIMEVVRVFTFGAEKYEPRNWESGQDWSNRYGSLSRHLQQFKALEENDKESNINHIAHAICNLFMLREYTFTYRKGDDRPKPNWSGYRIALDVDDVLASFTKDFYKYAKKKGMVDKGFDALPHYGMPYNLMENLFKPCLDDQEFWMGLEPICDGHLPFEPVGYVTSREIPTEWTEKWLHDNGFPPAKVMTVGRKSKVDALKELDVDVFVDDNFNHFSEINSAGITCYLFDASHNSKFEVGNKRIVDLKELV